MGGLRVQVLGGFLDGLGFGVLVFWCLGLGFWDLGLSISVLEGLSDFSRLCTRALCCCIGNLSGSFGFCKGKSQKGD